MAVKIPPIAVSLLQKNQIKNIFKSKLKNY